MSTAANLALLDQQDDALARLRADITRSEAIEVAVNAIVNTDRRAPSVSITALIEELRAEVDEDFRIVAEILAKTFADVPGDVDHDAFIARMDALSARGELSRLGFVEGPDLVRAIESEAKRHAKIQDPLAIVTMLVGGAHDAPAVGERLEPDEELRLVRRLTALLNGPGDLVGFDPAEKMYVVLMPWTDEKNAKLVAHEVAVAVADELGRVPSIGVAAQVPAHAGMPYPTPLPIANAVQTTKRGRGR